MENQNVTQLIEKLASKLGTTTEYLWSVLVKQAYVSSMIDIVVSIVLVVISYLVIRAAIKVYKKDKQQAAQGNWGSDLDNPLIVVSLTIGIIFVLISLFVVLGSIRDIITGLTNPEYWALNKVLSTLKGG